MPLTLPRLVACLSLILSTALAFHSAQNGQVIELPRRSRVLYPRCETTIPNAAVQQCLDSKDVAYSTNTSADWAYLSTNFNLRLKYEPAIITLPKTPEDVANALKCAAQNGLKVQAKGGGHSYGGDSTGGKNGSLIVSLEQFDSIVVDQETFVASLGGGVRLGNLIVELDKQGKRALPHGSAPGVGVGGHFTHGARGYASRKWGLGLDTIVGLDVVLANGSYIHANATVNTDIFYAMRGAAGSFGIALYIHTETFPQPKQIVNFWAQIPAALKDVSTAAQTFLTLQETALDPEFAIPELAFSLFVAPGGQFNVSGWCLDCDLDQFNSVVFPRLLKGLPTPASQDAFALDWTGTTGLIANGSTLTIPRYGYKEFDTFYAHSVQTTNRVPLARNELESYFDYMLTEGSKATSPWFSFVDLYGGPNSKLNSFASNSSAYSQRDALWMIMNWGQSTTHRPPFPDTHKEFIKGINHALTKFNPQNFGTYLANADPDRSATEWAQRAYGVDTYNKLLCLKEKYDPGFLFWNPQSIGNSPRLWQDGSVAPEVFSVSGF